MQTHRNRKKVTPIPDIITNPVKAIRAKCLDCCGGNPNDVRNRTDPSCALFPFRHGKNPYRTKRELSEEQRDAMAERLAVARQMKQKEG